MNTAFATGDVTIEAYSDIPSRIRAELRFRFRRQFGRIGVDGHPIVVVYRTGLHLLRFRVVHRSRGTADRPITKGEVPMTSESVLSADERLMLARLDDVWQTARETGALSTSRRTAALNGLRRKGLAGYRGPDGTAGVLRVGEWALTDAGAEWQEAHRG